MNREFTLNVPISKIDEEQRMVWGIATTEAIDSQNDIVDYQASKSAFPKWLGNIREMHQPVAVGKAIDIQFDDATKQVMIGAKISESGDGENAWIKVKEGILQGFSIGGSVNRVKKEVAKKGDQEISIQRIVDYDLSEVSLVDNPANPDAMLVMVKSIDGGLQRVEVTEKAHHRHSSTWWHQQYMLPIEKAQALYDNSMEKAGIAVIDSDPRDASSATVAEVKANTPVKGGTIVPKKVYGADGKSTTNKADAPELKKSLWEAAWLLELACELNMYIQNEQYEGEDVGALNSALDTIKSAIIDELNETPELVGAVELAEKVTNLKKERAMSDIEKNNVIGGEERNANAETIEDQRPPAGEPAQAEAKGGDAPISEESDAADPKGVKPASTPTASTDDAGVETESNEDQVKEEGQPKKAEAVTPDGQASNVKDEEAGKAVTVSDLKKFSEGLIAKLGESNSQDLTKMVGELTDKVEKAMSSLADRVNKLEAQPAPSKAKASYIEIEKGDGGTEEDTELVALLKRRDELAKSASEGTPEERRAISIALIKARSQGKNID